jgi:glycosyltransferase involved in cell wall biosynthesis
MAMPTAAFDTPVSREYLADAGVYAPMGDPEGLAAALARLLDNPAWAAELGRRLRQRAVEHYSWDQAGRRIVEIYESVISGQYSVISVQ